MKNQATQGVNTKQPRTVTAIFRLNYNQLFTIEIHKIRFNALRNQFDVVSKVTYKSKTFNKNPTSA